MSRSYLQHPLLKNPVKWLRGVPKRHECDLQLQGYYDTKSLDSNPFAASLQDTRFDVSKIRFPIGNTVQIVVNKIHDLTTYRLTPVLEKPRYGQNPASYVINNKYYIDFLARKRFMPIPLKYRHRSSSMIGSIKSSSDFSSEIQTLYKEKIIQLIDQLPASETRTISKNSKILLKPGEVGHIDWSPNSIRAIQTPLVHEEVSICSNEDQYLVSLFLKLTAFMEV
ncbi:hypothetical protein METSCH_A07180 [Metschnikowia aff. pulcherrima]|uniref:Uncharacterized protein n=1 Tax=Metschnikowia aff. pulcherrima TaxID=2163413 RepID=A0A4V1ADL0_9ASCO|nr:hypothetical protein METSCH_A07180 [Metschnikowia aff. pulcherrima]